jgi:hypothetical protein
LNLRNYFIVDDKLLCGAHFRQINKLHIETDPEKVVTEEERQMLEQQREQEKTQLVKGMAAVFQSLKRYNEETQEEGTEQDEGRDVQAMSLEELEELRQKERERERQMEEEMEQRRQLRRQAQENGEPVPDMPVGRLNITLWEKQVGPALQQPSTTPEIVRRQLGGKKAPVRRVSFKEENIVATTTANEVTSTDVDINNNNETVINIDAPTNSIAEREQQRELERQKEIEMEMRLKQKRTKDTDDESAPSNIGKLDTSMFEQRPSSASSSSRPAPGKLNTALWEQTNVVSHRLPSSDTVSVGNDVSTSSAL